MRIIELLESRQAKVGVIGLGYVLHMPVLVDGRHVVETEAAGFIFRGFGRGKRRFL
jgi:hypothetical protein